MRAYAGGLVTKGCVGAVTSCCIVVCGTGRSSIGHSGWPVLRSKHRASLFDGRPRLAHLASPRFVIIIGKVTVVIPQLVSTPGIALALAGLQIDRNEATREQFRLTMPPYSSIVGVSTAIDDSGFLST